MVALRIHEHGRPWNEYANVQHNLDVLEHIRYTNEHGQLHI